MVHLRRSSVLFTNNTLNKHTHMHTLVNVRIQRSACVRSQRLIRQREAVGVGRQTRWVRDSTWLRWFDFVFFTTLPAPTEARTNPPPPAVLNHAGTKQLRLAALRNNRGKKDTTEAPPQSPNQHPQAMHVT